MLVEEAMTEPRRKEFWKLVHQWSSGPVGIGLDTRVEEFIQSEIMRNREDAVKEWTEQMVFLLSALDLTITLLKEIRDGKPQSGPLSEKIELVEDIMRKKGNKAFEISDEGSDIE